ncbi:MULTISPECIES: hypothetical protein [unclassified Rathayibacter]|uniref:hypothetical protein n=1 Tax=unclassified Rathayibacter TaxID=2609250 RepID=UPI00188B22A4|nr:MULTISPECIES: hypothetical protein [unclassified Rathayibacter]MBF4463454.1 hypothetical protein [Rathayibacter sp. VKM Ac-2879]MBF4504823.1 hypothetical protein [Rathayibacter sp. VKM Ac-2878]
MNWTDLHRFALSCRSAGVEAPAAVERGLALVAAINAHERADTGPLLSLTEDEVKDRVTQLSIREHDRDGRASLRGMQPGIDHVTKQLAGEVRAAALPDLEEIIATLRPRFDEHAAHLVEAATVYGFTYDTTSDEVIDLADERASAAWRAVPKAWGALAPIVSLRIAMSTLFDVSPNKAEVRAASFPRTPRSEPTNYSVCFAAGDNWSLDRGYYVEGKTVGHLDWLALAGGGLRLNSPDEVRAKLDARGIGALPAPGLPQEPADPLDVVYPSFPPS